ncbi:MAG: hypothetical protein IIY43_07010, partial [Oscillospiraceae bacterium]|nr:hypothetical protein [Oscillospiraceae bacterium]
YCVITDKSGDSVTSNTVTMSVASTGPNITTQPSNQTVAEGATATFKVVATGTGLTYQWQYKTTTSNWTNSSSATTGYNTATLKVVGTAARNGFQYRCIVKDSNGNSVTSNAAKLTVSSGPVITTQPSNQTVAEGATATFKVVATGTGLTYQWQYKTTTSNWTNSSSATTGYNTATLIVVGTAARNGFQYRCKITDGSGNYVISNAATLTVSTGPKITRQPVNAYVKAIGDKAKITVKAEGEGLTYTWYYKNPSASAFSKSSYTTSTYATPVTSTSNGRQVYCVITDQNGKSVTTDTVTMSVATGLCIITQPEDISVANGAAVNVTIEAYGSGLTYQWYFKDAGSSSFTKSSCKTAAYTTPMNADRNGRQIYCVVTDSASNTVKTITVTLSMK